MAPSIFNPQGKYGENLTEHVNKTQLFLFDERIKGLQYVMSYLLVIALPLIFAFMLFDLFTGKLIEAFMALCMWIWLLIAYYRYRGRTGSADKQFRVYENIIRGFLLIFLVYMIFSVGWGDIDRLQWAYIMPLLSFLSLSRRESIIWMIIYIVTLSVMFFMPGADSISNTPLFADFIKGFKFRFVFSFSVICAVGFVWNYWVENTYTRLALRQEELRVSEKQYRDAYEYLLREMNEKRAAQQALAESLDQFKLVVNNAMDVIWLLNMDLEFTFISPAIEQMLGYTKEEYLKIPHEKIFDQESFSHLISQLSQELEAERESVKDPNRSRTIETVQFRKDGVKLWVELKMNFIYDKDMKPAGILGFSRDITKRKRSEEEKEKLVEQLQQAARLESIGTLAGGIAHDFNNLLMGIQGYASLLKIEKEESHPDYAMLSKIEQQVISGANLTAQLLGYARGGRYQVEPVSINEIIDKTVSLFGRTRKGISIETRFEDNIWNVEADLGQMERVFLNLCVNSSDAISGSGVISIETENSILEEKEVLPHSLPGGRYVKIAFNDNGCGMDEKTTARIFDPFFTTKSMGSGTGLGLATVYGIVKGHRGIINVESDPGRGTRFTIYLPASDKQVLEIKQNDRIVSRGTETILLVDDEAVVLETLREMLQSMGYMVYTASGFEEAVSIIEEENEKIDLVILDMILPGITGEEIFTRLREINPDVKILLASGYSLEGKAEAIMNRGCNGFIQKPFDRERLSLKIREVLG